MKKISSILLCLVFLLLSACDTMAMGCVLLCSGCYVKNNLSSPLEEREMEDRNGVWVCQYADATKRFCAVGGHTEEYEQENGISKYYFYPSEINGITVTTIGVLEGSVFSSNIREKLRVYVPSSIKYSFGVAIKENYCLAGKEFEKITYGATVASDYYSYYCLKFPSAKINKANVKFSLNYDLEEPFYLVDLLPYTLEDKQVEWLIENGEESTPVLSNEYKSISYQNMTWLLAPSNDYDFEQDENGQYYYNSKIVAIPPAPERKGYTFGGWYKEPECINEWDFETDTLPELKLNENEEIVFQETTLYAKWVK